MKSSMTIHFFFFLFAGRTGRPNLLIFYPAREQIPRLGGDGDGDVRLTKRNRESATMLYRWYVPLLMHAEDGDESVGMARMAGLGRPVVCNLVNTHTFS